MGGKLIGFYLTMGEYDYVAIGEAPNDEAAMTFALLGCEPALPPVETPSKLVYASPGWSDRDRQIYYYTPQGTELHGLRYSWFVNLELPFSEQRVADPELLSRMGFILDPDASPLELNLDDHARTVLAQRKPFNEVLVRP